MLSQHPLENRQGSSRTFRGFSIRFNHFGFDQNLCKTFSQGFERGFFGRTRKFIDLPPTPQTVTANTADYP